MIIVAPQIVFFFLIYTLFILTHVLLILSNSETAFCVSHKHSWNLSRPIEDCPVNFSSFLIVLAAFIQHLTIRDNILCVASFGTYIKQIQSKKNERIFHLYEVG